MTFLRDFYDIVVLTRQPEDAVPDWEAWHAHATDNAEFWPITDGGTKLIGGVLFKGHTVHIAIHPDWQKRWISKRLLAAYKTWNPPVDIVATPSIKNQPACTLAERLGFQYRGTTPNGLYALYVKGATPCHQ